MSRSLLRYDDLEEPQQPHWQLQPGLSYRNGGNSYTDAHKRKRRSDDSRSFKKHRPLHGVWDPEASAAAANAAATAATAASSSLVPSPASSAPGELVQLAAQAPGDAEPEEAVAEEEQEVEAQEQEYDQEEEYQEEEEGDEEDDPNRMLTHAEIWDDRALIGAWEAAEAEYEAFRTRRAEVLATKRNVHPLPQASNAAPGVALWYEAPPPGSKQALSAFEMGRAYAAERKVASAAAAPPAPAPVPAHLPASAPPAAVPVVETEADASVPAAPPEKKTRTLKGESSLL